MDGYCGMATPKFSSLTKVKMWMIRWYAKYAKSWELKSAGLVHITQKGTDKQRDQKDRLAKLSKRGDLVMR